MKKTLYKVVQGVWGADMPTNLYFETKEEADKYYYGSDYVDSPVKVSMNMDDAFDALAHTEYYFKGHF